MLQRNRNQLDLWTNVCVFILERIEMINPVDLCITSRVNKELLLLSSYVTATPDGRCLALTLTTAKFVISGDFI